jgi:hypothetical protein
MRKDGYKVAEVHLSMMQMFDSLVKHLKLGLRQWYYELRAVDITTLCLPRAFRRSFVRLDESLKIIHCTREYAAELVASICTPLYAATISFTHSELISLTAVRAIGVSFHLDARTRPKVSGVMV